MRKFIAAAALVMSCTLPLPAQVPTILDGAADVLRVLATEERSSGMLDLAMEFLDTGHLDLCCETLALYLEQYSNDHAVRGVLHILESELQKRL